MGGATFSEKLGPGPGFSGGGQSILLHRRSSNLQDTLHKEITSHTTNTMTSWKDHIVFKNSNIFPASKGLKAVISENQRNQSYQL